MTLQGRAMEAAAQRFGHGQQRTLCFTPCKKGYLPLKRTTKGGHQQQQQQQQMYACPLHNQARKQRLESEDWTFRPGEVNLNLLWERAVTTSPANGNVKNSSSPKGAAAATKTTAAKRTIPDDANKGSNHVVAKVMRLETIPPSSSAVHDQSAALRSIQDEETDKSPSASLPPTMEQPKKRRSKVAKEGFNNDNKRTKLE